LEADRESTAEAKTHPIVNKEEEEKLSEEPENPVISKVN
jgi:hypothetical protein